MCLCLGWLVSCGPIPVENDPPPAYILPEDKFIDMLTDCYLGEGAAGINVKNVTGSKFDSAYLFNPFTDRGISRQRFDTTIVWYSQHPRKLKEVYNKLLENLSRIQAIGTLGSNIRPAVNKYEGQDARFYFAESKMDSIENATQKAGYLSKFPYRFR